MRETVEPVDVDELLALAERATPGPWKQNGSHFYGPDAKPGEPPRRLILRLCYEGDDTDDANGELLLISRTAIPALCLELKQLREDKARLDWLGEPGRVLERSGRGFNACWMQNGMLKASGYKPIREAIDAARGASR